MFRLQRRHWRKSFAVLGIGLGSAAAVAVAADTAADLFLSKVRAGLSTDAVDLRGVACMESVERTRYAPRGTGSTCGDFLATAAKAPRGALQWRSRLRLDVTAGSAEEQFSLVQATRFERNDVGGILSAAAAGSGEFGTFLRSVAAGGAGVLQALGPQQTSLGPMMAFGFTLPPAASGAVFHGSLLVVPDSGGVRRLTVEAENVNNACRIQYSTDYAATRIGDTGILAPQSSTMEMISKDGTELRTETYYSGCRKPVAAPAPVASDPPKPIPSNIRFRARFQPPVDAATAATGDPVIAVIRTTVKDKQAGIIIHAGDRLHGRIVLIEQNMSPSRWNIAVVFQTIERGVGDRGIDQGVEQPVTLVPVDEAANPEIRKLRPANGTYFTISGASATLDQKYETEWETR